MGDPDRIWLQPEDEEDTVCEGRLWSVDKYEFDGSPPTEYVRADLYDARASEFAMARTDADQLRMTLRQVEAERDALRAQVEAMRKERRDDMRAAYKAGYETRKIGAGLSEGWATFFAGVIAKPTGSPDGQQ